MKIKQIALAFISLIMVGSVFAIKPVPFAAPGDKTVPFSNEVINDSKYAGGGMLDVHYDMRPLLKKLCV